jgi:hypothetical protein
MSVEDLANEVGKKTDRRVFLRRLGITTLGVVAGGLGLASSAKALTDYKCCNLCQPVSGSCTNCSCGTWCWQCYYCQTGEYLNCCECYRSPGCGCDTACSYTSVYAHGEICQQPPG